MFLVACSSMKYGAVGLGGEMARTDGHQVREKSGQRPGSITCRKQ